ncbi:hypothetical protein J6590_006183 [Homalodisca vitripennis]|nr:hypothetical protein J6590_006183 [Homalodisca vitripennis]
MRQSGDPPPPTVLENSNCRTSWELLKLKDNVLKTMLLFGKSQLAEREGPMTLLLISRYLCKFKQFVMYSFKQYQAYEVTSYWIFISPRCQTVGILPKTERLLHEWPMVSERSDEPLFFFKISNTPSTTLAYPSTIIDTLTVLLTEEYITGSLILG